jgi:signal transduction histidine kinase
LVTRHGSSAGQRYNVNQASCQVGSYSPEGERLDIEIPEFVFSNKASSEAEQILTQLERIVVRQLNSHSEQPRPFAVPLLGQLIPGAESCAIFYSNNRRQLHPIIVANLSQEFIQAIANEDIEQLLTSSRQPDPYIIINLPDNRRFEALSELSCKEGIRTLWLIPLRETEGSIFGAFLFASKKAFTPSREAVVSVTLLAAWLSAMLRQTSSRQNDSNFKTVSDSDESPGTKIEDDHRVAAIDRLMNDLTGSQHDKSAEKNDGMTPHISTGIVDIGSTALRMYKDKHGIPVAYDAETDKKRKQTKSDTISVLSHELLSPLTLIKGYTATLLQLNDAITEEQKEQYLKGIDSASNRVIRLLENLRDMTRLEETDTVSAQPVYFLDLVRTVVSEIQSQTKKHVIKLRSSARLPRLRVDPEKIEQVLNNLLTNAIKYSPQGGDIDTEIQVIQDEQELRRMFGDTPAVQMPCLIVSIADNGIGIPGAELDNIFERFYRVNSKLSRATPGVGLGLYICRIIVEAHGGQIWARNRLQGGSTFSFSLPL